MLIHVVKPGDSVYSVSRFYGVSPARVIADNELPHPDRLVVGQTLVIPAGVTRKLGTIEVNGYAYPTINMDILGKTLPNLTYLAIFSYDVNSDGSLSQINDTPLIQAARRAGVAPLMVITNKGFNSDVASAVLNSTQVQDRLLANVLQTLRTKNYYGLDIDFEYVYPSDRENYNNFLRKAVPMIKNAGYIISTAVAPKISSNQTGFLYAAHDYPVHGRLLDHVIIMTYEWGFTFGPPLAVAPLNEVRRVLNYATYEIPPSKILMGIPNYGYDWTLPYVQGTAAKVVSNTGAVDLALSHHAAIQYDPVSQAPFFNYYDTNGKRHIVWFEDARSITAKLSLPNSYKLGGVSYWTIGRYFPQNWLVLRAFYNVRKVI